MKKLFIVDAYALIYRAHYALINRPLINSKGINTSAIYGFLNTLVDILQKETPTHLAVAFDLSGPTFRHDFYPEYKANRDEQPEDITIAVPYIKEILKHFPIAQVSLPGYEADDVAGTLVKRASEAGFEVCILTPDKDYGQLLFNENIYLYKPAHFGNGIDKLSQADILEKWGVKRVDQVIDMLALQGDTVDNIPGVKGIGEKTAKALLKDFDSVEDIYENLDKLTKKQKENLLNNKENAFLSKRLARIELNVPIEINFDDLAIQAINTNALIPLLNELEFRTLTTRILKLASAAPSNNNNTILPSSQNSNTKTTTAAQAQQGDLFGGFAEIEAAMPAPHRIVSKNIENTPHAYHCLQDFEAIKAFAEKLNTIPVWAFDTETTGLDIHTAELVGLSFAFKAQEAYYIPVPPDRIKVLEILEFFRPAFENEKCRKIAQNLKYDMQILYQYGIKMNGPFEDTMLMHYILEPERRHNMDYLAETYLGYAPVAIETLIGKKGKKQLTMRDIPIEKVSQYAAEDADITFQLYEYFLPLLKDEQRKLYETIEMPLVPVLAEMEIIGMHIDKDFLNEYSKVLAVDLKEIEEKIFEAAGVKFNINSPGQVGEVLFGRLQIPYRWSKTKTQNYSTDEEKLTELSEEYTIVQDILEYRKVAKLLSTYIEALPLLVNEKTGRVHSSFNQALTATGRLSSQNPNLQNIPIRSERGREIRKAFTAQKEGFVILAADYSQIELRLVAELSKDQAMLEAFKEGLDIHAATAARIYKKGVEEVSKFERYAAKTINFAIIYGAGASKLSKTLDIKRTEAVELIEQYYQQYASLRSYMTSVVEEARTKGYVTTLCGRRRYLRDLDSRNSMMRSHAERNAINTPIQGTAADMIKIAMIKIHNAIKAENLASRLILQVHDELVFEAKESELEKLKTLILDAMQNAIPNLEVPIEVGIDVGDNWLEAH